MRTAAEVGEIIRGVIADAEAGKISWSEAAWTAARACTGWAYVFGAYGEYCDPSNRRRRASADHPRIRENCKNFNGDDNQPGGCVGCKWFLGTAASNPKTHEGRTRFFDCRGFVYWILHQVCGMWDRCPAGATSMWKNAANWKEKGTVRDGVPEDVLVCLFVQKADKTGMEHVGFGFRGETCECSKGVEYHGTRAAKWTHWAVPVCVEDPDPDRKPTLRKGDSGTYVSLAQEMLMQRGYPLPKYGADGKFGNETRTAVKAFQEANGLKADGVIGPDTWKALEGTEPERRYTVTIPGVTFAQAEALIAAWPGATRMEDAAT